MRGRKREKPNRTLCDRDALCPMLKHHTRKAIVCEGVIPDTISESVFLLEADKDTQYRLFCCGGWETCEMYRAIYESKYRE
ncbi:MAG: hypothetical protein IJI53_02330 [Clostridia bacterium]|nr:hypothetical protein [Clostridia bacterium]